LVTLYHTGGEMTYPVDRQAQRRPRGMARRGHAPAASPLTARIRSASRRMSAGFVALLLAALVAFAWQSFVTQTHIHLSDGPVATARAASTQVSGTQPAPDRPIDCPICHDGAIAGHYLSPGPVLVLAAIGATLWLFAPTASAPSRHARSHAWRSRAPPRPRI